MRVLRPSLIRSNAESMRIRQWPSRYLAIACFTTLTMIGCGSGEDLPETAPVTGIVTFEGKPVEGATVMFFPKNGAATNPAAAYTDKEGKYSLTTYERFDGALLGTHEVTVQLFDAVGEVKRIPGRYGDVKSSGLTATVKEGENSIPLELKS